MAEKNSFPQIPTTVWWGVRGIISRSPSATIDDTFLSVELSVQPAAARQYVAELRRVGILDENSKPTEIAKKWRMADTYAEAVQEIVELAYPQALRDISPPDSPDRDKATAWFQRQGLGEGAARNKAATYMLLTSSEPGDSAKPVAAKPPPKKAVPPASAKASTPPAPPRGQKIRERSWSANQFPLNLNIQIHIGADASAEQINSIFQAMKKYLSDDGVD